MMNQRPNQNGSGGSRSTGVLLLHPSNRVLLEREGVSRAPVMASIRPSALPSLQFLPRASDDVRPKRPTTAHRKRRDLQSLVQAGRRAPPGWINSSSNSLVPALPTQLHTQTNQCRRNKELSFTDVLKNYKLLPDSRPSSPESLHQPEMMRPRSPVSLANLYIPLDGQFAPLDWSILMYSLLDLRGGLATLCAPLDFLLALLAWSILLYSLSDLRGGLSISEAAQPEEAARGTTSPPRDITRP